MTVRNDDAKVVLFACDSQQSVLAARSAEAHDATAYSPYGQRHARSHVAQPGFNGELPEPATGHYLLGNGYRAYNPVLMRFHQPDSWSPFGAGGLNPYVYCIGDPVNHRDPTGHMAWLGALGGTALEALMGARVAAAQPESGSDGSSPWSWMSIVLGVASAVVVGGIVVGMKRRWGSPGFGPPQTEALDLSALRRSPSPSPSTTAPAVSPAPRSLSPAPRSHTPTPTPAPRLPSQRSRPPGKRQAMTEADRVVVNNAIDTSDFASFSEIASQYGKKRSALNMIRQRFSSRPFAELPGDPGMGEFNGYGYDARHNTLRWEFIHSVAQRFVRQS